MRKVYFSHEQGIKRGTKSNLVERKIKKRCGVRSSSPRSAIPAAKEHSWFWGQFERGQDGFPGGRRRPKEVRREKKSVQAFCRFWFFGHWKRISTDDRPGNRVKEWAGLLSSVFCCMQQHRSLQLGASCSLIKGRLLYYRYKTPLLLMVMIVKWCQDAQKKKNYLTHRLEIKAQFLEGS